MSPLPLLAAAALAASLPAHHGGGALPLKRGVYVDVAAPCNSDPMSTHSWYSGAGYVIQASHAHCVALHVRRHARGVVEVREACRDDSMPDSDYSVIERIQVISPTEYVIRNNFGRFHARWCHE